MIAIRVTHLVHQTAKWCRKIHFAVAALLLLAATASMEASATPENAMKDAVHTLLDQLDRNNKSFLAPAITIAPPKPLPGQIPLRLSQTLRAALQDQLSNHQAFKRTGPNETKQGEILVSYFEESSQIIKLEAQLKLNNGNAISASQSELATDSLESDLLMPFWSPSLTLQVLCESPEVDGGVFTGLTAVFNSFGIKLASSQPDNDTSHPVLKWKISDRSEPSGQFRIFTFLGTLKHTDGTETDLSTRFVDYRWDSKHKPRPFNSSHGEDIFESLAEDLFYALAKNSKH